MTSALKKKSIRIIIGREADKKTPQYYNTPRFAAGVRSDYTFVIILEFRGVLTDRYHKVRMSGLVSLLF